MNPGPKKKRQCFIVAPAAVETSPIRAVFEDRGWQAFEPEHLFHPGRTFLDSLGATIRAADLVVAVILGDSRDSNVLVAVGMAEALGKRVLILAPQGVASVPEVLHASFILPVASTNVDAIGFAIDQLPGSSKRKQSGRRAQRRSPGQALGARADELLRRLDSWRSDNSTTRGSEAALKSIIEDSLNGLDLSAVASGRLGDVGADFAVWDDALEPLGNPTLIEVKTDVSGGLLPHVQDSLRRRLEEGNATFGLLLWGIGPSPVVSRSFQRGLRYLVFGESAEDFIRSLRRQSFSQVVMSLVGSTGS